MFVFDARPAAEGVEVDIRYAPPEPQVHTMFFCSARAKLKAGSFPGFFRSSSTIACTISSLKCSRAIRNGKTHDAAALTGASERGRESSRVRFWQTRIRERGPIPFAEFMRECLYHPEHGYYSRANARGALADYYTSVDVHPIFGRLLARQLAEMWELLGSPRPFLVVEAGAGVGRLAGHILDFAASELPEFYAALRLCCSGTFRRAARGTCGAARCRIVAAGRVSCAAEIPASIPAGCIFSNELLDALPTHRVVMEQRRIARILRGNRRRPICRSASRSVHASARAIFSASRESRCEEGQQAEVCLEACRWIENAGRALGRGFVMTIDYGHEARALYDERHNRGTLLAYRDHAVTENILDAPGEQDLTSHVNFTALDLWGRRAGLDAHGPGHAITISGRAGPRE